jgi:hypothetical protein
MTDSKKKFEDGAMPPGWPTFEDGTPKFCDGEDDETPEQTAIADADAVKGMAEALGITVDEAKKLAGL